MVWQVYKSVVIGAIITLLSVPSVRTLEAQELALVIGGVVELEPGQGYSFRLGRVMCCTYLDPVDDPRIRYVVAPSGFGEIDATSGELRVSADAPHGVTLRVKAEIPGQPTVSEATVMIYDPVMAPYVGYWREIARIPCGAVETEIQSVPNPIEQLRIRVDGRFSLTWHAFETYWDYWGEYRFAGASRRITLSVDGGNRIPSALEFHGEMWVEDSTRLILSGPWLGVGMEDPGGLDVCGHIFRRPF